MEFGAAFFLAWLIIAGLVLYRLYRQFMGEPGDPEYFDRLRGYQARLRELGEANVITIFQQRRRRRFRVALFLFALATGVLLLGVTAGERFLFGPGSVIFAAAIVILRRSSQCPVCGWMPGRWNRTEFGAPATCERCLTRLAP